MFSVLRWTKQGTKLICCGRIQTGSYTDKTGRKVYTTDVVVEEVEFAESKSSQGEAKPCVKDIAPGDGFVNIPDGLDEEMPFN